MSKIGEMSYRDPQNPSGILYVDVADINPNEKDDFCILTLEEYVEYTPSINPLCLPNNPEAFYHSMMDYYDVKIYGFGYDEGIHAKTEGYAQQELQGTPVGSVKREHRHRFDQEFQVKARFRCQDDVNMELEMYTFLSY